jgi:integral membrane sensor domain MASE1
VKHAREPTYSFLILTIALILVNTALAWISVAFIPAGNGGVALVYIAVAFMILFTLWFGAYGAIAAYVGTLFAGVLTTASLMQHPEIAVIWAVAGLLQVIIPLVAVRKLGIDLALETRRDISLIILFGVILNNLAGAAWGAITLGLMLDPPGAMGSIFSAWLIGNVIVTLLIVPLALMVFTPKIEKSRLFVKAYWD